MERVISSARDNPDAVAAIAQAAIDRAEKDGAAMAVPEAETGWTTPADLAPERSQSVLGTLAVAPLDLRSLIFAIAGGTGFFLIASMCLALSRFDMALASLWMPNAAAVAALMLVRVRSEIAFFAAIAAGSVGANLLAGNSLNLSLVFTAANTIEVLLITLLMRRACESIPDMNDLSDLGRFLLIGGIVGPAASTLIAATALVPGTSALAQAPAAWFIADSLGMILIVPALLLIVASLRSEVRPTGAEVLERSVMMIGGLIATYLVFRQPTYPLLFLIPPVTLLIAFRVGGLGTALFVPGIAIVGSWMNFSGYGPLAERGTIAASEIFVLQSFVAANFLSGLPIAAILAGRERIADAMIAGRRELALLADNVTDAVFKLDLDGVITYASPSVKKVLGRDPNAMIGDRVTDRPHEDSSDKIAQVLGKLQAGLADHQRFTYRRLHDAEDGTPVFIEAECAVAYDPKTSERAGFVVSARDVTDRVELELLLTRARRHAENAARAKSEFLANMSHEIRTPMNGVLGFAELILQDELTPDHRRHTEMIVQSGRSMMMLLNDILDLSKIEAGQIDIDQTPVDLHATLSECAALHRAAAEKKGLRIEFERRDAPDSDRSTDLDEHPWVVTDALRLRQISLNLIGNAVKFTERGEVEVSYWADAEEFCLEVRDTGIGISKSRIDTVFAPFTQAESDTARRFGGTGLGLTISRQLAELLGGTITVESDPGKGSTFRLTLPATYAEPEERPERLVPIVEPQDLPQSARVLLVEDHDVNRLLGTEMLERCGQSVAIAHDGNEAIAMVIDSVMRGKPYDLVLMDIQMPGCDGYAATRAIRAEGITPDVMPIVALTANAFPEDISAARDAGMQAHLAKPLVFADLARALGRWLPTRIIEADAGEESDDFGDITSQADMPQYGRVNALDHAQAGYAPDMKDHLADQGDELVSAHDTAQFEGQPRYESKSAMPSKRPAPSPPQSETGGSLQSHSPDLLSRWTERRSEAVEAVRLALQSGKLGELGGDEESAQDLARLVHKLAGTAAIFGEPELGDQATAFERALRMNMSGEVREALAFELLSVADDPIDTRARG